MEGVHIYRLNRDFPTIETAMYGEIISEFRTVSILKQACQDVCHDLFVQGKQIKQSTTTKYLGILIPKLYDMKRSYQRCMFQGKHAVA